ncbi:MAG: hypothetical protein HOI33_06940, partial [Rhodospirillaceae bacterium]|nr:hypothetical protein [Rhodospirillaceae bacterium]
MPTPGQLLPVSTKVVLKISRLPLKPSKKLLRAGPKGPVFFTCGWHRLSIFLTALFLVIAPPAWAAPRAYITNQGDNSVSVIDTLTDKVITTIAVGDKPAGVAVNHDGSRIYVTSPESRDVSVIDGQHAKVIATIPA